MNYIKQSFRDIKKRPLHFLTNLSGLSIAFAVFMLIMLFVINEFNFDKFNTNGQRIYRIEGDGENQVPLAISRIAKKTFPEIEKAAVIKSFNNPWIRYNSDFFEIDDLCFTENSFFEIFTIPFVKGNSKTALKEPYTIVLSESVAKKIFGDKDPVGQQVNFKNQDYYTVTGVIKDLPDFQLPAKAFASFKSVEDRYRLGDDTWNWGLVSYVMLKENNNAKQLESKMDKFFGSMERFSAVEMNLKLRPFNSIYLATDTSANDETKHGNLYLLIVLCIVGVLIILIASINFINLTISLRLKKMQELAVKRILGGSRASVFIQYMVDSVILCVSSVIVALLFVLLFFNAYENLIGRQLNIDQFLNFKYVLVAFSGIVFLGIIYGFFPAYLVNGKSLYHIEKKGKHILKTKGLNNGLITFQYAISILLIIGTVVIYKQLDYIRNRDLGFNDEQLLCLDLTPGVKKNLNSFKSRLLENPNIKGISFASDDIIQFSQYSTELNIDDKRINLNYAVIDPNFIPLLNIKLIQGDNFSWDIKTQSDNGYIINEAAWDILKNTSLKNKGYKIENRSLIGVVSNFHFESFHNKINPVILYWGNDSRNLNRALLKLTGHNITHSIDYINGVFDEFAPESLFKFQFVNQELDYLYNTEKTMVKLFTIFSLLAIFIASIGIISLSKISAENRIKEIGIRKVNGAKVSEILSLLNKDFVRWVIIAFVMATPIAYYAMNKWLENFAYKTSLNWWIFALAGILALGIALLTVSWQSWRAATRNPVEALRYE